MAKVALKKLKIPRTTWDELPTTTRYSVLLLGQVFNETMMLHKIAVASTPDWDDESPQSKAMFSQMNLITRLLSGKIYEAHKVINSKDVKEFFDVCFPLMEDGQGKGLLKNFNVGISNCRWLAGARNGHVMHFPSNGEWAMAMAAMEAQKRSFELVMGDTLGDSFYSSSAEVAGIAFFLEADPTAYEKGLKYATQDLMQLSRLLTALLQETLDTYLLSLCDQGVAAARRAKIKDTKVFDRPAMKDCHLPFFADFFAESKTAPKKAKK
jgi:hypothetical protein